MFRKRLLPLAVLLAMAFSSCEPPGGKSAPSVPSANLESLWADLGGADPAKSYEALGKLAATPEAISFLTERLKIIRPDPDRLKRLLADLDADDFSFREGASNELGRLYEVVEPELQAALKNAKEPEEKDRLQKLLTDIEEARLIPMLPGEPLRRLLGIQLLEMAGTPEAKTALEMLAKDCPIEREREASKNAVGQLRVRLAALKPPASVAPISISVTNSIGMKFQYIPRGTFLMGSPEGEEDRGKDEIQHPVKITKGFYLGAIEVTQKQWKAVMGEENNPSFFEGDDKPLDTVSWNDAVDFCKKLSEKESKKYRLPTEAEWEYACRAGTTTKYNTGDDEVALKNAGWYDENSDDKPHPVGQKKPNAWDLYDMHGNVDEWCQDWYGDYPRVDVTDPTGPATGRHRVLRGGTCGDLPQFGRSADRFKDAPGYSGINRGFRVALDP